MKTRIKTAFLAVYQLPTLHFLFFLYQKETFPLYLFDVIGDRAVLYISNESIQYNKKHVNKQSQIVIPAFNPFIQ